MVPAAAPPRDDALRKDRQCIDGFARGVESCVSGRPNRLVREGVLAVGRLMGVNADELLY